MPRLVSKQMRFASDGQIPRAAVSATEQLEDYLERVVKYIPAEIIALYMLIHNISPSTSEGAPAVVEFAIYALFVMLTAFYLNKFGGAVPDKAKQIVIGTISFVVWSYGIDGSFFWPALERTTHVTIMYESLASIVVVVWSAFAGLVVPRSDSMH